MIEKDIAIWGLITFIWGSLIFAYNNSPVFSESYENAKVVCEKLGSTVRLVYVDSSFECENGAYFEEGTQCPNIERNQ